MRANLNHLEKFRIRSGPLGSHAGYGRNGAFKFKAMDDDVTFFVIVSDGMGWEHVSVSIVGQNHTPTWEEMCIVKDLFWEHEETVIQYHPPKSDYVDCHPYVLHLWRPVDQEIPRPPSSMVGPR